VARGTHAAAEQPVGAQTATGAIVLLIENDRDVREATARLLERWSCRTLMAHGLNDIAPLLAELKRPPDVVLADYHLDEGETGLAALEEVRRLAGCDIPAVVLTADHSTAVAADVLAAGCELMHKPIKPAELRALMTHLLARRGSARV
jgi:DNA-binding response OmpR family regulator